MHSENILYSRIHSLAMPDYLQPQDEQASLTAFSTALRVSPAIALNAAGAFETKKQAKANIKNAIGAVAKILGNTPAICQKCYIDPVVLESYLDGDIIEGLKRKPDEALESEAVDLRASEVAILKFLQAKLAKKTA